MKRRQKKEYQEIEQRKIEEKVVLLWYSQLMVDNLVVNLGNTKDGSEECSQSSTLLQSLGLKMVFDGDANRSLKLKFDDISHRKQK